MLSVLTRLFQAGLLLLLLAVWVVASSDSSIAGTGPLVAVATGGSHTCALTGNGEVWCWGANDQGQLGGQTVAMSAVPLLVEGLGTATQLSAGSDHSCVVTVTGGVRCWGRNDFGQLGNGVFRGSAQPSDVCEPASVSGLDIALRDAGSGSCEPMSGVVGLSVGGAHACVVVSTGSVRCWGINQDGELGDGSLEARNVPVIVGGLARDATEVTSGHFHTCALLETGAMQCWGFNATGQLGDGTTTLSVTPVDVLGLPGPVVSMSAGGVQTCALTSRGELLCWGGNADGQVGDGSLINRRLPTAVAGLDAGVRAVAAGWKHTCAILADEGMACWGQNDRGQLGNGSLLDSGIPLQVTRLPKALLLDVGGIRSGNVSHSCAFARGGGLHCWGANVEGQLGIGTLTNAGVPVAVRGLSPDVDCSGEVTSVDVALLLQLHVGLLSSLACPGADVNGDAVANSLDAVLILQFIAGL